METNRRAFLGSLGAGLVGVRTAVAQGAAQSAGGAAPQVPVRRAKTTPLFKSPEGYPNAIAVAPDGLWIAEQKTDNAHLVDWNGKVLKTVKTESKNTSGMGYGDGCIWMAAWIAALRLRGILRVDAKTWEPELLIPYSVPRAHGVASDKDAIWMVTGTERGAGLIKYDAETGRTLEIAELGEADSDPHGLAWHNGVLYSCDAGIHPGWPDNKSPTHGYIFRIDLL